MTTYIIRRLAYGVVLVVVLAICVFLALNVLGDPVILMLPLDAPPEQIAAVRHQFGYDRPLQVQLADYLIRFVQLDFGQSLKYGRPAGNLFQERFPNTLALAGVVMIVAFPLGLLLGILGGLRPLSMLDRLISVLSFATIAMPSFWLGLMFMAVFAIWLGILPTSGFNGIGNLSYYVLPGATLAARPVGRVAQLARASLVDEMRKQYVTVARAKGLTMSRVIIVHALKNAMNPVITLGAAEIRVLLGGSIVVESIFGWPGLGSLLIEGITGRDLHVVETCIIAIGIVVIFINLAVDLLYACFDPRIVYK